MSICLVGAFMGCAASGIVADKYGRRRAFQLSTIPLITGALFRYLIFFTGVFLGQIHFRLLCFVVLHSSNRTCQSCIDLCDFLLFAVLLSFNVPAMLVGRFLVGAGLGLSGPLTSLYISEVCIYFLFCFMLHEIFVCMF